MYLQRRNKGGRRPGAPLYPPAILNSGEEDREEDRGGQRRRELKI